MSSVSVLLNGYDFQYLVFWKYAAEMLDKNSNIKKIGFEYKGCKSFDDVVVFYDKPKRIEGKDVLQECFQVKYHTSDINVINFENLINPEFIGAKSVSYLQKVANIYFGLSDDRKKSILFTMVSTWPVDINDALGVVKRNTYGCLDLEKLKSPPSGEKRKVNNAIAKICDHLKRDRDEVIKLLSCLRFRLFDTQDTLSEIVNYRLKAVGLKPISESSDINKYKALINGWCSANICSFDKEWIIERCQKENLYISDDEIKYAIPEKTKFINIIENKKINIRINEFDLTYPAPKVCPEYLDKSQVQDIMNGIRESDNHILLHGVGGIGKTTILRKLHNILKTEFDCVMWIEYNENLLQSFKVVQSSYSDENILLEKIKEHLRIKKDQKNLIFVDNVSEVLLKDQVYKELERSATFIVTSRIPDIVGFKPYEISPFSSDEVVKLFEKYYSKEISQNQEEKIRTLFTKVDRNTLVIELVARAAKKEFMSFDSFIDKLINNGVKISQAKIQSGHDGKKDRIVGHLQNLYKVIDLDEEKKKILFNFIVAPDNGINFELMEYLEADKEALEELSDYGWISKDDFGFKIHSLIKSCIELQCDDFKKYAEKYIQLYSSSNLILAIENCDVLWECLEVLVKMVNLIEIENTEEMFIFYNIVAILGYFRDEESLNAIKELIIENLNKFKDDEDYSKLNYDIKGILVWGYGECDNYEMAFKYNYEVKNIIKMKFSDDNDKKANCYHNFGTLLSKSNFREALNYFQESKDMYIECFGENSLEVANVNYNIANLNYIHDNIDEALNFAQQSLEVLKNDEVSIELAGIKKLMGKLLSEQYKVNQDNKIAESAEDYLLESLKIYIDIWGGNHPDIGNIKFSMAYNLNEMNRTQSALKLYIDLLDDERCSIDVYPEIIDLYFSDNDYDNWDKYSKMYLDEATKAFGCESEDVKSIKDYIEKVNAYFTDKG